MPSWDWQLHPEAEAFLKAKVHRFLARNRFASNLAVLIEQGTSTRFFDWVDHMALSADEVQTGELAKLGFTESKERTAEDAAVFRMKASVFFPLLVKNGKTSELALSVEDLEKFRNLHVGENAEGQPSAPLRRLVLSEENGFLLSAVERHGSSMYLVEEVEDIDPYVEARRTFETRPRSFDTDEEGIRTTERLIRDHLRNLNVQRVADAFFRAERNYWQSRNHAAMTQKARQDELGLGWSNRDHHTFRSSRENFASLIRIFELVGLKPRERFHAGAQAGWGAQILEDEDGRTVVFADVDLAAEEREEDFAHRGLADRESLGTVGLWVGLHGESILQAGMHHLAARFRFDNIREDLRQRGVDMMKPFSDFPFLRQAFTEPEMWQAPRERVANLERTGQLSREQAEKFARGVAVGSHLENIQRSQGFKGFNQDSVSAIIRWTDPRRQLKAEGTPSHPSGRSL
ncbi:MAG: hypothetical protein ACE14S_09160 [Candidatus Bathyarchaeia archaeon]